MSQQITTAFVKQFRDVIFHLSQQKGSRLRGAVRNESQVGNEAFYERLGAVTAQKKLSRHADTPQLDTPHSRRRVTMEDYVWADLIDKADDIRTLIDPANQYVQAAMWAMGRAMDDEIIAAAIGNAYAGQNGGTSVALPDSQKLVATDGSTSGGVNLNVDTLRRAKRILDANDVDPSIRRYIAVNALALESLLAETEVTSSDFNTVKALVQGEVDTFLGFKFIRTERLVRPSGDATFTLSDGTVGSGMETLTASTGRSLIAWAEDGLLLSVGQEMEARISERDDKNYSTQAYVEMAVGATRLEEDKVVEILVAE